MGQFVRYCATMNRTPGLAGVKIRGKALGCGDAYMDVGVTATQEAKAEERTASIALALNEVHN